jgi:hypothetical protein
MRGSIKALVVWGALMAAGVGAAGPAAASSAVPSCSVTFEGTVSRQWSNPANWSTGQVPGPDSDVCITTGAPIATGTIDIHSLQISANPIPSFDSLTISDILTITSDSGVIISGTLSAPTIDNAGGSISTGNGASTITSPALSNTGIIEADNGTLRLTDNPLQLDNGTLNGGTLMVVSDPASNAIIVNGDISSIAAGAIYADNEGGGNIENQSGGNALASLSSIGPNGFLEYGGTLNGNLVSQGGFEPAGADVHGDYTQTSTGALGSGFGLGLNVGQTATLSGTLRISIRKTCTPEDGETKTLMTFAARSGTFTTTPSGFNVLYGPTSVQAQYEGPVNRNGCSE